MEIIKINKSYSQLNNEEKEYIISLYYEEKDLKFSDLQELLGVSKRLLNTLMKEYNINSRLKNRYTLDEQYFKSITTEQQAYILGYICADGYVGDCHYNNIVIQSKDLDIIEKIAAEIKFSGNIRKSAKGGFKNSKQGFVLNFSNASMAHDLRELGIKPNKSLTFNKLLNIPQHLQRHFFRGYFDGDGSITYTVKQRKYKDKIYKYDSLIMCLIATPGLIEEFINEFNIIKYAINKSKTEGLNYLRIQSNVELKNIYRLMYEDATIFLNRKKDIWDKYIECL